MDDGRQDVILERNADRLACAVLINGACTPVYREPWLRRPADAIGGPAREQGVRKYASGSFAVGYAKGFTPLLGDSRHADANRPIKVF